jgi:hypothetical protein
LSIAARILMTGGRRHLRSLATAAGLALALTAGGCGGVDGVDLNGKVFDWLGVSAAANAAAKNEPQLAARTPLVLPPDANRLPEPGAPQPQPAFADQSWPNDPEQRKVAVAEERERLHLAYCRGEIQWKDKVHNPQASGANRSPYGPCPGLFGGVTSSFTKNKQE